MTILNKISFGLFSLITAAILFMMFPVVICPMMWMLFIVGLIAQFVPLKPIAIVLRIATVLLFLFVAFRIYNGFTTDFSISAPDSLALKFAIFAGLYLAATITMYVSEKIQKYTQYLSFILAFGAGYHGYTLVQEVYYEAFTRFKTEHPDCIALNNFESKDYLYKLESIYGNAKSKSNGMVFHSTSELIDGYFYRIVLSDGSEKNMIPIFSVEKSNSDTVVVSSIMFRYEKDLRYGFIHYRTFLPEEKDILNKDSAQAVLDEYFTGLEDMMKK